MHDRRSGSPEQRADDQSIGAWLDPLCDKTFAISMLATVAVGFDVSIALAGARELVIAPLVALYHLVPPARETLRFDFSSDWSGKLTTSLQFAFVGAVLLVPPATLPLAAAAGAVGAYAAFHYVRRGIVAARVAARHPLGPGGAKA